uniref:FHA domain-containing protein n=1 Tax=Hyaloperonospora arabidopsidis (strain Emoy2) TaxID=559515 RepID=M4B3B3_HYAAE
MFTRAASPVQRNRHAKLEVNKGSKSFEHIPVGSQSCYVLGRSQELCDIFLPHPSVSRRHAVVVHDEHERVCLMDLDSAQGTFVNGQEMTPQKPRPLRDGDSITFGASTTSFVFQNAVDEDKKKTKDERVLAAAACENSEFQQMMREMQSFGGPKRHKRQEVREPVVASEAKAEERQKVGL